MAKPYKISQNGNAEIDVSVDVPEGHVYQLLSVTCALSAAPTTAENFTVTANMDAGEEYDVVLYSVDPAASSATSILWSPDADVLLVGGDSIDLDYTNTDKGLWGVQVMVQEVY